MGSNFPMQKTPFSFPRKLKILFLWALSALFVVGLATALPQAHAQPSATPTVTSPGSMPAATPTDEATVVQNASVYRFKIGDFKAMSVSDGNLAVPPSFFVPNAAPEEVKAALYDNFLSEDSLFYLNVLYVDTGEHRVLIDSGAGGSFGPTAGFAAQHLREAGIDPESIDTLLISHAHGDHVGGIVSAEGAFIYPNAKYYISQPEWDFWSDPNASLPNSLLDDETKKEVIQGAQKTLAALKDRITQFEVGSEVIPGIRSVDASGHTPGQVAYVIGTGEQQLMATGDVFFSNPLNLEHPDWEVAFDSDSAKGVVTRKRMLAESTASRMRLIVPHMPFPGIGYVRAEEAQYGWVPINWSFDPVW
jgi:glyoxylase-like metal-dependent hydrolase (beta-lactamase superfamily II)